MLPLKAEVYPNGKYRVLALPFDGPLKGRDMDRERFTERTDPKPHWFEERPVLWHHGQDRWVGDEQIGRQGPITKSKEGWWAEMWLDKQNRYFAEIDKMIQSEKMFGSSGSVPHLVKKASDGELLVWPHIEQTLSPVARNPYSVVRATKALVDFEEAGLVVHPGLADLLKEAESLSSDLRLHTSATGEEAAKAALNTVLENVESFVKQLENAGGSRDAAADR